MDTRQPPQNWVWEKYYWLNVIIFLFSIPPTNCWAKAETSKPNPIKAIIDDHQPGWRALTEDDFTHVNSAPDTWSWKEGVLYCTGKPVSVMRTKKTYTHFEMVVEWNHQNPGGNSGLFIWASPESIDRLQRPDNPGPPLPDGIEIQMLDHAFAEQARTRGEPTDWFSTHGDVFPVRVQMTPFPPLSPVAGKQAAYKDFGKGDFEIVGRKTPGRSFPRKHLSKGYGQWNHYYVRAINGEVRLWVNGEEVSGGTDCNPSTGFICLESEGAPILFRNLRIRVLP